MLHLAQNILLYTLPFLFVLTFVVTVHEFGHFIVAKWCGVAVDRFSVGFGRALLSWRDRRGTEWRIAWIPLGGYVKFAGDENAASVPDKDDLEDLRSRVLARDGPAALNRYFHFKPLWQRAAVVAAGPAANFLLAIVLFAALAMVFGVVSLAPRVGAVTPGSPAAVAGFRSGDLVLDIDGQHIGDFADLQRSILLSADTPIAVDVDRGGQRVRLSATPARRTAKEGGDPDLTGLGFLGFGPSQSPADIRRIHFGPISAVAYGARQTADVIGTSLKYMRRMFSGHESGRQFSGILGMAGRTGEAAQSAAMNADSMSIGAIQLAGTIVGMAGFISVALGFANLLPIPVLDGGHLLFYGYEAVARRPLAASVQAAGYRVGFALLIGLMLFVTWNDLQRFRVFNLIGGLFS